jgi:hypothetical protein
MSEIPSSIDVTTRHSTDVCIAEMRIDIKYIKEKLDITVTDHENRIRTLEQTPEDCQQTETLSGFQNTLNDHEARINSLESVHDKDEGADKVRVSNREVISWGLTIAVSIVALWQFMEGRI